MRVTHVLLSAEEAKSQHRKKANERRSLTFCVSLCGGKEAGTNQYYERKPARQWYLHPANHRQRVRLGQTKGRRDPGGLTNCRAKREGKVRTVKES